MPILSMAQDITGTWNGLLEVPGAKLRVVFHIESNGEEYSTKMDSPDQGAFGLATDETTWDNGTLTLKASALAMVYEGKWDEESEGFTGTFKQGGGAFPLSLSREEVKKEEEEPKPRPQDPTDFPYKQEAVNFTVPQGGHTMAGTLTIPSDGQFEQVVVLISGSGPQNRNEELLNHRPFLVLSDHLTRQGIAVLRYDDRGVGESTGKFGTATSRDFANDASAAVAYLASRSDMNGKKIGLAGHSEGGMIAPMVASENEQVDFIALLAGPGIPIPELMLLQTDKIAEAGGASEEERATNKKASAQAFSLVKKHRTASTEDLSEILTSFLEEEFASLSEEQKKEIGDKGIFIQQQVKTLLTPWFRYFLTFEPDDYLSKVSCPVLAVNGELDLQVTSKENLNGIQKSLEKARNRQVTIHEFKQLNHLFQKSTTGAPSEYADIEETFNPEALSFISDWILKQK
ncbi:MAG: alpha/beta hydrolase [Bacteroidota bacterium]